MLENSLPGLPTEEDQDEGVKDLVEITLKKMVSGWMMLCLVISTPDFPHLISAPSLQTLKVSILELHSKKSTFCYLLL